ncbi:LLM class flavin-dependent oxidoreductase [Nostoc sp.]|uniref:LLM class flavin-dependent oxidoreductase n=1 Tax=Nostoc sp. TaxID=1180 RepID=UPI002FFA2C9E
MSRLKQLKLGAFMRPVSIHTGAWRYPGALPDANFNFPALKRFIQKLEQGKFDAFFMADHLAVLNMPINALKRSHTVTSFEPFTLLSALASVTEHIGLVATASTTYDQPYHIARRFASLDHISGGRAGWNIVTTANPDAALNFGLEEEIEHDERYRRAREFYDVVTGLWDSFAEDAFIRDVEAGIYFDPAKLHVLNHKGKYLSVRGPLNIARPVQGWPVIVQAGASEAGRQLAAETAEAVFAPAGNLEAGKALFADIKGRARAIGRDPDRPLPEIPSNNAGQSSRERIIALAQRENLTIRQLAQRIGSYGGLAFIGTPQSIADEMEQWLIEEGSDGFNIMFPFLPEGLNDFVDKVVPELQRRGIFRHDYEGKTLRENLGLTRPVNRFFQATTASVS